MTRIRWRGRSYERDMDEGYIQTLNEAYNYFFFHYDESPLLVVNCNELDFVRNQSHFDDLVERIVQLTRELEVGDPARTGTDLGPLTTSGQRDIVAALHAGNYRETN